MVVRLAEDSVYKVLIVVLGSGMLLIKDIFISYNYLSPGWLEDWLRLLHFNS